MILYSEIEFEAFDPLFAESVFLQQLGAAGVGTQTGILVVDADDGVLRLQLVGVGGKKELPGTVMGYVAFEGAICPETHAVFHFQKTDTGVVAVLLGHDIRHIFLFGGAFIETEGGVGGHIRIVFSGASAEVAEAALGLGDVELVAQPGQPGAVFPDIATGGDLQGAVSKEGVLGFVAKEGQVGNAGQRAFHSDRIAIISHLSKILKAIHGNVRTCAVTL